MGSTARSWRRTRNRTHQQQRLCQELCYKSFKIQHQIIKMYDEKLSSTVTPKSVITVQYSILSHPLVVVKSVFSKPLQMMQSLKTLKVAPTLGLAKKSAVIWSVDKYCNFISLAFSCCLIRNCYLNCLYLSMP